MGHLERNTRKSTFDPGSVFTVDIDQYLELPGNVYVKDANGFVLECNLLAAKSAGFAKPEDVIGATDRDFVCERESEIIQKNDLEVITQAIPKIVLEMVFADSRHQMYLSYKNPLRNLKGKIIGLFGVSLALDDVNFMKAKWMAHHSHDPLFSHELTNSSFPAGEKENKKLSKREKECVYYLMRGMTAKKIAKELNLSPRTIEYYIEKMKGKFNCTTKMELINKTLFL